MVLPVFSHPCTDRYIFQWGNTDQFRHSESIISKYRFEQPRRLDFVSSYKQMIPTNIQLNGVYFMFHRLITRNPVHQF